MSSRKRLFAAQSDWSLAGVHGLDDARARARRQLASGRGSVYQVRHLFIGPTAMRSVRTLRTGSRDQIAPWLAPSGPAETGKHGIHQSWLRRSPADTRRPCCDQVRSLLAEARPVTSARSR